MFNLKVLQSSTFNLTKFLLSSFPKRQPWLGVFPRPDFESILTNFEEVFAYFLKIILEFSPIMVLKTESRSSAHFGTLIRSFI